MERSATAGSPWAGKTLVRFSRRIMASAVCVLFSFVAFSVTDTPRSRELAQQVEERVEQQRQHDDAEDAADHQVEGRRAADAGEPGEDVLAQTRTVYYGRDRRDAHEEHRGDAHPGNDDRPRQGQLDAQEPLPRVHAHSLCGLRNRGVHRAQTGNRVAQDRQQPVHDQRDDRRHVAEAEDRDKKAEQRERGDGKEGGGDRERYVCGVLSSVHQHAQRHPYHDVDKQRYGNDYSVTDGQLEHVVPAKGYVVEKAAHPAHRLSTGRLTTAIPYNFTPTFVDRRSEER